MRDFVSLLKLSPKILTGLMIASGLLIFLPGPLIDRLYMGSFKSNYGFIIGSVFIISISLLISYMVTLVGGFILKKYKGIALMKHRRGLLKDLDHEEKEVLREMMKEPGKTLELPTQNGVVVKLAYYHIICPAGTTHLVNALDMRIPYFVQPWVVEAVNNNPNLLM